MSDEAPAPAVTPKSAYHHGDLRAQLIEAVRELVETHGPDGFSVAEAARRAGVSSAAPYKHFKDRPEILRAVASEALDRLRISMEQAAAAHPVGSLEAVAAIGLAYVDFARAEPGVFRLVFGLTEGHENAPDLQQKGECCFGVVVRAAANRLGLPPDDPLVMRRAYMLWSFVHGHSFLHIDGKARVVAENIDEWLFLNEISRGVLGTPPAA
ncbi:TetR/AcrR family transcriptional regulator [Paracoccus sp. NSM]|uniref:TetR/AcrR family transcriptional regulator n=1 Tax=Paracoccus sp. NSM TaxID=3457784 RepID=UPI0040367877